MAKQEILLESGTNEMEFMTFRIGKQSFGMNVAKIQSIMQFDEKLVTGIPMAHPYMMGMMLYRDTCIPLIDLAKALNMEG